MLRVTKLQEHKPSKTTVLGWHVMDIVAEIKALSAKGVEFQRYPGMEQDQHGIWTSPAGAECRLVPGSGRLNVLSLSQF